MKEMREGFLGTSNHELMKGEANLTGTWGGEGPCRDEKRLAHSEMAHYAET